MALDPLTAGLEFAGKIVDLFPNGADKAKVQAAAMEFVQSVNTQQAQVNAVEAANSSLFVSGWRPFIGWICGIALAWHFIGIPIFIWITAFYDPGITLPDIGDEGLYNIVLGMLGLGGMRTYEKKIGVTK